MFCMYFLMITWQNLGISVNWGSRCVDGLSHVLRMKVVGINRWRTIVLGKELKVKMLLV